MSMDSNRQNILTNYISYLYTTGRTYDTIGKYIKYVTDFLESAEEINRRGYLAYKRENANIYYSTLKSGITVGKRK